MEETENTMTLQELGALLRERRIERGLTEENVADQLKITSRLVRAIEEGDMHAMPHAVYARGFIRAYAKLLAVDEKNVHEACALLKDPEEELREQESRIVPAAPRRGNGFPWLALLLCVLFVAAGGWYLRDVFPDFFSSITGAPQPEPMQSLSSEMPEARAPMENAAPATPAVSPSVHTADASATHVSAPAADAPIVLGGTPLPPENASVSQPEAAIPAAGHRIVLTALGDCWISTTADGKNSQRILHKGDTLSMDFQEKLVMKLGNAGGVEVTYDGKPLPPVGKAGQVKTVTFPLDIQN